MRRLQSSLLLLAVSPLCFAGPSHSAEKPSGFVLVANKGDNSLGIIDPVAGRQIAEVPEGGVTGHEITASPDGRLAYVPIYGNSGVGQPGTDGSNLVVIDLESGQQQDANTGVGCQREDPKQQDAYSWYEEAIRQQSTNKQSALAQDIK